MRPLNPMCQRKYPYEPGSSSYQSAPRKIVHECRRNAIKRQTFFNVLQNVDTQQYMWKPGPCNPKELSQNTNHLRGRHRDVNILDIFNII